MATSPKATNPDRDARAQKRAREATKAMSDYEIEQKRIADNTAKLRALRLAKEEADRAAAAANPVPVKKGKAKAKSIPVEELNAANDK